jgi:mono/diheme cytochrome c family protein
MSTSNSLCVAAVLALVTNTAAVAQTPGLGMAVSEDDIATWDITTFPSGANMPPGRGTAAEGASIYAEKCALCHGANGEGGIAAPVVGGDPLTNGIDTRKTIKNFWASATTLFDFIRRAMPWQAPRTLTDDEVYALSAYLLAVNDIIDEDDVMNAETLPAVAMPNRDGFMPRFPELMP